MTKKKTEEAYTLTPLGCLYAVLMDYADRDGMLDVRKLKGEYDKHVVDDFFYALEKCGHLVRQDDDDDA